LRLFVLVAALIALIVNNPHIASAIAPHDAGFYTVAIATFALASALALLRSRALHLFFATLVVGLYFAMQAASGNLFMQRSFFGVVKAFETDNGRFVVMAHGTTEHGAMRTADRNRKPTPISYYHDSGAIAATLSAAQQRIAARNDGKPANMGVVGLGTGTILCRRGPGEIWTIFEIDQAVVNVASDPRVFGFLPHCGNGDPIILGDARLRLADQPDGKFDYLLIDAFSSDSIPVHLLTVEAIELYRAKLAPGGMLAVHISNRYMELGSVMAALAAETGMAGRTADFAVPDALRRGEHINPTSVAVLARTEADLGSLASDPRWRPLAANGTAPWTDDYSDILSAILRRQFE
jgi:hypothetical protein